MELLSKPLIRFMWTNTHVDGATAWLEAERQVNPVTSGQRVPSDPKLIQGWSHVLNHCLVELEKEMWSQGTLWSLDGLRII